MDKNWTQVLDKFLERLPGSVLTALLGIFITLLGATGGGILGIPPNSIQPSWQILYGIAGGGLFLIGLWRLLKEYGLVLPSVPTALAKPASLPKATISISAPAKGKIPPLVKPRDALGKKSETEKITFEGTVLPESTRDVWLVRQKTLCSSSKGLQHVNECYAYPVETKSGKWNFVVPFHLSQDDITNEYTVWIIVPNRETLWLFQDHWTNRQAFDRVEESTKNKKYSISRPWIPLPSSFSLSGTVGIKSEPRQVIIKRS